MEGLFRCTRCGNEFPEEEIIVKPVIYYSNKVDNLIGQVHGCKNCLKKV